MPAASDAAGGDEEEEKEWVGVLGRWVDRWIECWYICTCISTRVARIKRCRPFNRHNIPTHSRKTEQAAASSA